MYNGGHVFSFTWWGGLSQRKVSPSIRVSIISPSLSLSLSLSISCVYDQRQGIGRKGTCANISLRPFLSVSFSLHRGRRHRSTESYHLGSNSSLEKHRYIKPVLRNTKFTKAYPCIFQGKEQSDAYIQECIPLSISTTYNNNNNNKLSYLFLSITIIQSSSSSKPVYHISNEINIARLVLSIYDDDDGVKRSAAATTTTNSKQQTRAHDTKIDHLSYKEKTLYSSFSCVIHYI